MELTFIGSGNAFASGGRYWSSFLVDRKYQFDAPPTLLPHLKQLGIPLAELEVIFLTHFHGDHFMGLPFLFLEFVYLTQRTRDLHIVGPPGVQECIEDFANRCYPEVTRDAGYRRVYVEARPGTDQQAGPVSFRAVPMNHVKGSMEAFGYRAKIDDRTIAYTGDTMFCDEIVELAEGCQVLVADCTYTEGSGPEHMGLDDVKIVRERISPETTMVLTHLNGEPKINGLHNVLAARDLVTFRFD